MKSNEWEKISLDRNDSERLQVPGGWIVRTWLSDMSGVSVHQIFISDPTWEWELK